MKRKIWVRNAEFAVLLPATLVMAPLAAFVGLGMAFALVQQKSIIGAVTLFMLLIAVIAGIVGLTCVWISLLIVPQTFVRHRPFRIGIACGIVIGIADALYWLATLRRELNSLGPSGWGIWLLMLAGPIVVGAHQFVRLVRLQGTPAEAQSGQFL